MTNICWVNKFELKLLEFSSLLGIDYHADSKMNVGGRLGRVQWKLKDVLYKTR